MQLLGYFRQFQAGALRHELWLYSLFRTLEAAMFALLVFGPTSALLGSAPASSPWVRLAVASYMVLSLLLLFWSRTTTQVATQVIVGTLLDIVLANIVVHAFPTAAPITALMLLLNVGAASFLMTRNFGLVAATLASVTFVGQTLLNALQGYEVSQPLAEPMMYAICFYSVAIIAHHLGQHMLDSDNMAVRRAEEVADLSATNELIIRRMRTGVMLVDRLGHIRLANEAAMLLLGENAAGSHALSQIAPELAIRLTEWLRGGQSNDAPLQLGGEQFEVVPRFVRLMPNSDNILIFLDDTSLVSRRAESLTLTAMGRFSASLAHEIRNPLAAISYASQLLEESKTISDGDRRMVQIIHQQCMRTNGIVESVLSLARRERATAEHVELVGFLRNFIDEFQQTMPDEIDKITLATPQSMLSALIDPKHLHQVITALVQNARRHGHLPGQPARITLHVHRIDHTPVIDVIDRGPGIPDAVAQQLFRPFYTTSEHGTGLGLYIARELCRANGADLDHVAVPGGGCCFRISVPGQRTMLPA